MEAYLSAVEINRFLSLKIYQLNDIQLIGKLTNSSKITKTKNGYMVEVNESQLEEQMFENKVWYRSKDKRYAVFYKDGGWRLIFQKR